MSSNWGAFDRCLDMEEFRRRVKRFKANTIGSVIDRVM